MRSKTGTNVAKDIPSMSPAAPPISENNFFSLYFRFFNQTYLCLSVAPNFLLKLSSFIKIKLRRILIPKYNYVKTVFLMITFTKFVILSMIDAERIGELGDDPIPLS